VSVCGDSLYCPTTEEYISRHPCNDRVEWFIQLSDELIWQVEDRDSGSARAKVTMRRATWQRCRPNSAQGYAPKRRCCSSGERRSRIAEPDFERPTAIRAGRALTGAESTTSRPPDPWTGPWSHR